MTRGIWTVALVLVLGSASCLANGQSASPVSGGEGDDNPRANVHIGFPVVIPLNPAARAVHLGFGLNVGGGYNLTRRHGLIGEYMWNNLFPTNEAQAKLRNALKDPSVDMKVNLMAFTANYRYELRGKSLGTYFMGGAGLFYRHTRLSKEVTTGRDITCTPTWEWWGFECSGGYVKEDQTVGSWSATGPGYSGGIGFTFRVGEPPYRAYVESRYHYAPNSRINTQLIDITVGIRY